MQQLLARHLLLCVQASKDTVFYGYQPSSVVFSELRRLVYIGVGGVCVPLFAGQDWQLDLDVS